MAVAFDEMNGPGGDLRPAYLELSRWLKETTPDALEYRRQEAELLFRRIGITFASMGDAEAQERLIPFDVIPRIMSAKEWTILEKGLKQRVRALNMFLRDIYHGRDILRANIVTRRSDLPESGVPARDERPERAARRPTSISPASISCGSTRKILSCWRTMRAPLRRVLHAENREIMMGCSRTCFARHRVAPVERYPDELLSALRSVAAAQRLGRADRRA